MAETLVKNQICNSCGADVRTGSLFCYNCGGSVASETGASETAKNETVDEVQPLKVATRKNENGFDPKSEPIETKPKVSVKEALDKLPAEPNIQRDAKMKSAAAMRGKSKLAKAQKVEIIWEERESAPNFWFILVALFLAILAAVILFLAIRMK